MEKRKCETWEEGIERAKREGLIPEATKPRFTEREAVKEVLRLKKRNLELLDGVPELRELLYRARKFINRRCGPPKTDEGWDELRKICSAIRDVEMDEKAHEDENNDTLIKENTD